MNNFCVYIHKNKINNKVYIGQTGQKPEKRWDNGKGYITSSKFWNAIQKYGWDNFEHIIIKENLTAEEANELEEKLILEYHSQEDDYGYNINYGGNNHTHTEDTKRKIGEANHIALQGIKWSEEHRALMSKIMSGEGNPFYGKHHTEETKKKISESRKGKHSGEEHHFYGKHHTEEELKKMSENRRNKGGKQVICLNTKEIFNTANEAARWCGLSNGSGINQVCHGQRKTAGKHPDSKEPLKWEYVIKENKNEDIKNE